ncbi:hypothetical protein E4T49_01724 [Aureobasidium sp. EXF-10728]|nr:hypothetical protein E4T49_01724 [Aureobasidium sp. EXF-10728]
MSTTSPSLQRKRDRLKGILPGRSKTVSPGPSMATVSSSPLQASQQSSSAALTFHSTSTPISTQSASASAIVSRPQQSTLSVPAMALSATTSGSSVNPAFLAALQKHLHKLPEAERHKVAKFLSLLDRLLGGIAIAIQANPDISSIAVGGVKLIIDVAVGFTKYFGKLTDMLDRVSEIIAPLERYAQRFELLNVGNALIDVYGDVLDFCRACSALFLDKNGKPKIQTTLTMFLHSQWSPFEAEFGELAGRMDRHCSVLLHAAQAELLYANKGKYIIVPKL